MKKHFGAASLVIGVVVPVLSIVAPISSMGPGSDPSVSLDLVLYVSVGLTGIGLVLGLIAASQEGRARVLGVVGALINGLYLGGYGSYQIMRSIAGG